MISNRRIPKAYESAFWEPNGGGLGSRRSSGDFQRRSVQIHKIDIDPVIKTRSLNIAHENAVILIKLGVKS